MTDIEKQAFENRYKELETDELLELYGRGTLLETAYDALETELQRRNVAIPPRPNPEDLDSPKPNFFSSHWRGQRNLASAYWLVGVAVGTLVGLGSLTIGTFASSVLPKTPMYFNLFIWAMLLVTLPYFVFACVSIWRCAYNVRWPGWGLIARFNIVVWILLVVRILFQLY